MKRRTVCLFGGALIAAGIAGQASAGTLGWNDTPVPVLQFGEVYLFDSNTKALHAYQHPGGPYTTQLLDSYATTEISALTIRAEAVAFGNTLAEARAHGFFTVDGACTLKVSWDLTEAGAGQVRLNNVTDATIMMVGNQGTSGLRSFLLQPDEVYSASLFTGYARRGASAFAAMEVPAPSAGLFAGTSMVIGAVRRRRLE